AIHSPLLEDINLAGARGILVNVTAGNDLEIGEFEEVGNAVGEFAAEDATVVVGTVIDPNMSGELRVTVVATGLGRPVAVRRPTVDTKPELKVVKRAVNDDVNYEEFDRPTVLRQKGRDAGATGRTDPAYLDVPAFLRRQAD